MHPQPPVLSARQRQTPTHPLALALACFAGCWFTLLLTALAQTPTDPNEGAQLTPGPGSGDYTFAWYARTQNLYYLQWSTDMVAWQHFPYVLVKGPAPFTSLAVPPGATFVFNGFSQILESLSIGAGATLAFTGGGSGPVSYRFHMAGPSLYVRAQLGPITAPADADGDGIFDYQEILSSLDPHSAADTDTDGLPDDWERFWFAGSLAPNGTSDADGDGDGNLLEFLSGTNPLQAGYPGDLDGDGVSDTNELAAGTDATRKDNPAVHLTVLGYVRP